MAKSTKTKPFYNSTIPDDWEVKKLGDCCLVKGEYGINAAAVDYSDKLPTYIRITDISDDGNYITEKKVSVDDKNSGSFFLKNGDIVFARTGATVGKTYLYDEKDGDLVFAGFLIRFRPDETILLPQHLKYFTSTKSYWDWVKTVSMRSGQPGINAEEYSTLKLPIPPLSEQKAIAHIVDFMDTAINKNNKLIAKKEVLKKWLLQTLMARKKRLIGFNGQWKDVLLGDFAEIIMGQSPEGNTYNNASNGIALINGPTEFTEKYPVKVQWTTSPTKICEEGDILLCVRGSSTGRLNIANEKYCIGRGIAAIRAKENSDHSFVGYIVENVVNKILKLTTGSTFPNIDSNSLRNIKVHLPQYSEQIAIAKVLQAVDKEIQLLKTKTEKLRSQKKGVMQALLTGKKRLKIK